LRIGLPFIVCAPGPLVGSSQVSKLGALLKFVDTSLKVPLLHDDNLQDGVRGQHRTQKLAHDLSSELRSDRRDRFRVLLWV
jgi:hypothetical protein